MAGEEHEMAGPTSTLRAAAWILCLPLLVAAATAGARSYQTEVMDGHLVRCSTVNTGTLPEASLEQYRLRPDPNRGLLTCLVQRDQVEPENVPAEIRARYRAVGQTWEELDLREIRTNDQVSYLGIYDIRREETLQFEVMAEVPNVGRVLLQFDDLDPQL
jgi:hypothetical protein